MKKQQFIVYGIMAIAVYLISTGVSYAAFTYLAPASAKLENKPLPSITDTAEQPKKHFTVDAKIPRTEVCPINGKLYTKKESDAWQNRRPIVTMIENSVDARPQSGLSYADAIYEAVAEGGITRFMGVFYCDVALADVEIAPVRSVRMYFLNWATEYNTPVFMHVGGANDFSGSGDTAREVQALEKLMTLGWREPKGNDFDTTFDLGFPVFYRNPNRVGRDVATEHTMVASLTKAYAEAEKRGYTGTEEAGTPWKKGFTEWQFKDEAKVSERGSQTPITYAFWKQYASDYGVTWTYDKTNNVYKRETGGKAHTDLLTDEQLSPKNVVILFAKERGPLDKNLHLFYQNIGTGTGLLFQDGNATKINWSKQSMEDRMTITDSAGKEVKFNRGQIWISMLPIGNEVTYK